MSSKNSTKVLIGGKIYTLGGYESEEYLQKVAAYLNNKLTDLSSSAMFNRQHADVRGIMLSLNVADDYFKASEQLEELKAQAEDQEREIYSLKHQLVMAQLKLEEFKKELGELKEKE